MGIWIVLVVLGAFGLFCALWVLFGLLLPRQWGAAAVYLCRGNASDEAVIRRYLWLYHTGLIRCPLILVDRGLTPEQQDRLRAYPVILCTPGELYTILNEE